MGNIKNSTVKFQTKISMLISKKKNKWSKKSLYRVLLITSKGGVAQSQVYPFYFYLRKLKSLFNIDLREIDILKFSEKDITNYKNINIVLVQPWFSLGQEKITSLLKSVRESNPKSRIIYLDSAAPIDLRYAESVNPYIDLYIKKSLFLDRKMYGKSTQGDTNLVQYYEQLYRLPESPEETFYVPQSFLDKIVLGPSFVTSEKMLTNFMEQLRQRKKTSRIHARIMCKGAPWYQAMRKNSLAACSNFKSNSFISDKIVNYQAYYNELLDSKICFSPFGYGEVCWRDYEAILAGALLIKPDMSHIEVSPNIFIPYETYIPVKWDFSDLEEKMEYYLSHESEAREIAINAYDLLHEYCNEGGFVKQMTPLFLNKNDY